MSALDSHVVTVKPLVDCEEWHNEDNYKYHETFGNYFVFNFLGSLYLIRRLNIKDQFDQP